MLGLEYWLQHHSPSHEVRRYFPAEFVTQNPARFDERTPTAAITLAGVTAETISVALGRRGIATWWGNFYAVGPIGRLGLEPEGVLRIGLTHYNTAAEVERALASLRKLLS